VPHKIPLCEFSARPRLTKEGSDLPTCVRNFVAFKDSFRSRHLTFRNIRMTCMTFKVQLMAEWHRYGVFVPYTKGHRQATMREIEMEVIISVNDDINASNLDDQPDREIIIGCHICATAFDKRCGPLSGRFLPCLIDIT
jgi:hypothetical protein